VAIDVIGQMIDERARLVPHRTVRQYQILIDIREECTMAKAAFGT